MRKYRVNFSLYLFGNIDVNFFGNTSFFFTLSDYMPPPIVPIINNIYNLNKVLKIKGNKNEIDITRYNIDVPTDFSRCCLITKIYN